MPRYTDMDALMEKLEELFNKREIDAYMTGNRGPSVTWNDAVALFKSAPTVDAIPVVRCKDCKFYGRADKRRFYRGLDCLNGHIDTIVPDMDFCSKAERRE